MVGDVEWRPSVQQAASRYSYLFGGPAQMIGQLLFDGVYDLMSFDHDAEHYVLAVQARCGSGRYEKLTSVCVWTRIGHSHKSWLCALHFQVFIGKRVTVYAYGPASVVVQYVSTLDDELVEHPMEFGAGVSAAVDAFGQNGDKVGHRFRRNFAEKTDLDRTQLGAGHLHVQVRHVGHRERLEVTRAASADDNCHQ